MELIINGLKPEVNEKKARMHTKKEGFFNGTFF